MSLSWIQQAVRVLNSVQDSVASATIVYTRDGQDYIVPARLGVVTGESTSYEGVTLYYTERIFKVTKDNLGFRPERGDKIELYIYDANGHRTASEYYVVMSEQGLDVAVAQGNFEDAYRIYAKRTPDAS